MKKLSKVECVNFLAVSVIFFALFQNLIAVLLLPMGEFFAGFAILAKEFILLLLGGLAVLFRWRGRFKKIELCLFGFLTFLTVMYFFHGTVLESYRQIIMIPFVMMVGSLASRFFVYEYMNKKLSVVFALLILLSFLEYFLADDSEWFLNFLGLPEFLYFKGFDIWMTSNGVLRSFYSWDFYDVTGNSYRRMAGLNYMDPVVLGQFFFFPAIFYFLRRNFILSALCFLVVLLCLSKGGLLAGFISLSLVLYWSERFSSIGFLRRLLFILLCVSVVYFINSLDDVQSVSNHLNGLLSGFDLLISNPFGLGIGGAGNYGSLYSGEKAVVGESFAGTLMAQIGIFAFLYYVLLLRIVLVVGVENRFWLAIKVCALAVILCSLISESAFTYSGTALIFFLAAMYEKSPQRNLK